MASKRPGRGVAPALTNEQQRRLLALPGVTPELLQAVEAFQRDTDWPASISDAEAMRARQAQRAAALSQTLRDFRELLHDPQVLHLLTIVLTERARKRAAPLPDAARPTDSTRIVIEDLVHALAIAVRWQDDIHAEHRPRRGVRADPRVTALARDLASAWRIVFWEEPALRKLSPFVRFATAYASCCGVDLTLAKLRTALQPPRSN